MYQEDIRGRCSALVQEFDQTPPYVKPLIQYAINHMLNMQFHLNQKQNYILGT